VWILIPSLFTLWGAWGLRGTWFFYDEWSLIRVELHRPWSQAIWLDFNGHLWTLPYLIYRIQVYGFGLDSHLFVELALLASLLALQLAIAGALRAGGVPVLTSLMAGGLLAYLSAGLQNSTFAVQVGNNTAAACCVGAIALVAGRAPSRRLASLVGLLLLAAVGCDSGTALALVLFAAVILYREWRPAMVATAAPAFVALAVWFAAAPTEPTWPATYGYRAVFAGNLLCTSLGALVGVPTRAQFATGVVVLIGLAWSQWRSARRGYLTGARRSLLIGGLAATVVVIGAIAVTRAGLVRGDLASANRYLVEVDVPLVLAVLPGLSALALGVARERSALSRERLGRAAAPLLIAACFVFGVVAVRASVLGPFHDENVLVHHDALSAVVLIQRGCARGLSVNPASEPASTTSPQMTTRLLEELVARHRLSGSAGGPVDPSVRARMCSS